jgi:hypothetical protein
MLAIGAIVALYGSAVVASRLRVYKPPSRARPGKAFL